MFEPMSSAMLTGMAPTVTVHRLLTVADVCKLLGVSKPGLYDLIRSGAIASLKIGARRRFTLEDVQRYIEERRRAAREAV